MPAFDAYALIVFLIHFALGVITCMAFLRLFFRKEIRIFKNLKRTIYLLRTGGPTLENELELLKGNGLYTVNDRVFDLNSSSNLLQTLNTFAVLVIGYSTKFNGYQSIVDHAKARDIPIVVLAGTSTEITPEHQAIFRQYNYFDMCNTPSRLLTTIFNLSIVTPHDKK